MNSLFNAMEIPVSYLAGILYNSDPLAKKQKNGKNRESDVRSAMVFAMTKNNTALNTQLPAPVAALPSTQLACGELGNCGHVNRKHAPKSKPAAVLAAKKIFETLLLPVGFVLQRMSYMEFFRPRLRYCEIFPYKQEFGGNY